MGQVVVHIYDGKIITKGLEAHDPRRAPQGRHRGVVREGAGYGESCALPGQIAEPTSIFAIRAKGYHGGFASNRQRRK